MTKAEKSVTVAAPSSAIVTMAERFGVEGNALFLTSLKNSAFKAPNVTNEQLMALIVVANQYKLNPFTRELYAFPDRGGGIVPIVSIDGWHRIANEHPQNNGVEYTRGIDEDGKVYGQVTIHRKDRQYPTVHREYLHEVKRNTDPWKQYEYRMLEHKTYIQAYRIAFGFAGIYEPDEADRILQTQRNVSVVPNSTGAERVAQLIGADKVELDEDGRVEAVTVAGDREADDDLPI